MKRTILGLGFILAMIIGISALANASPITLSDGNSTLVIDPASQAGAYTWIVDGVDNLYQQWFWYRVGSGGPESSIDPLFVSETHTATELTAGYQGAGFFITVEYSLQAGPVGSFASDIGEQIRIENQTGSALDFHFFQYSDFDMNGTASGDIVHLVQPGYVTQRDAVGGLMLSETSAAPLPSRYQLDFYPSTLLSLDDASTTNLANGATTLGPSDVTWAFQWDKSIPGHGAFLISKDKIIEPVPEPASMLLLGGGLLGVGLARLFGKRKP